MTTEVPRILVYGIEQVGLPTDINPLATSVAAIEFAPMQTDKRFHDFDGVILFQSIFETVDYPRDTWGDSHIRITCLKEEMLRRQTQLYRLVEQGGWACFILHRQFIDQDGGRHFDDTDLCKLALNAPDFYRRPFRRAVPINHVVRDEFKEFLNEYGAAITHFEYYGAHHKKEIRVVCKVNGNVTGIILLESLYFIPARLPTQTEFPDFFRRLASAVVATSKKLVQELPSWAKDYELPEDKLLLKEEVELQQSLSKVRSALADSNAYKRVICFSGDTLVDSVRTVLEAGYGMKLADKDEEYIEDITILDGDIESILVEVKGVNENVKSTHIYQADLHRGRREKGQEFPSILIVNTFIKSSNSVSDKLRPPADEQIKLATDKKVLLLRTIDLLNLLHLVQAKKITRTELLTLFKEGCGWLEASTASHALRRL